MTTRLSYRAALTAALIAAGVSAAVLSAAPASAAPTYTTSGGNRAVSVTVTNDLNTRLACEAWVAGNLKGGGQFDVGAHSRKTVLLMSTPGRHQAWIHCHKGSFDGPQIVKRPLRPVQVT